MKKVIADKSALSDFENARAISSRGLVFDMGSPPDLTA